MTIFAIALMVISIICDILSWITYIKICAIFLVAIYDSDNIY